MTLTVTPLTDADVEDSLRLQRASFHSGGGMSLILGRTPEIAPAELASEAAKRRKALATQPYTHFLKVVDSELDGRMVAVGYWDIYEDGPTDEQFEKLCTPHPPPEGVEGMWLRAWNDFFAYIASGRRKYFPRAPVAFLNLLAVDPEHHRRGAGTLLVKWGVEKADEIGIEGFVEGSKMGAPLYEKFGFRVVYKERFDMGKYGDKFEGVTDENVIMMRPKKEKDAAA